MAHPPFDLSVLAVNATQLPATPVIAPDPNSALWTLPAVLAQVTLSRSHWLAGVKAGRYPAPVRLSARRVAWRAADIRALIASL